jgi:hypothetical protein
MLLLEDEKIARIFMETVHSLRPYILEIEGEIRPLMG